MIPIRIIQPFNLHKHIHIPVYYVRIPYSLRRNGWTQFKLSETGVCAITTDGNEYIFWYMQLICTPNLSYHKNEMMGFNSMSYTIHPETPNYFSDSTTAMMYNLNWKQKMLWGNLIAVLHLLFNHWIKYNHASKHQQTSATFLDLNQH